MKLIRLYFMLPFEIFKQLLSIWFKLSRGEKLYYFNYYNSLFYGSK